MPFIYPVPNYHFTVHRPNACQKTIFIYRLQNGNSISLEHCVPTPIVFLHAEPFGKMWKTVGVRLKSYSQNVPIKSHTKTFLFSCAHWRSKVIPFELFMISSPPFWKFHCSLFHNKKVFRYEILQLFRTFYENSGKWIRFRPISYENSNGSMSNDSLDNFSS